MATQYVLCNNIDLSFWIRPLGIGTEYATHVYLPEVAVDDTQGRARKTDTLLFALDRHSASEQPLITQENKSASFLSSFSWCRKPVYSPKDRIVHLQHQSTKKKRQN